MKQTTANCPAKARRSAKGERILEIRKLKLVPMLKRGESWITPDEALRRARANSLTNHGKRFAKKLAADLKAGRVSCKNWRVGQCVIFGKGSRRRRYGSVDAWYVYRDESGFYCYYLFLTGNVGSNCCRLRCRK